MTNKFEVDGESLLAYAEAWWKEHRPSEFSEQEHIENPTVNLMNEDDDVLARYIAYLVDKRNKQS